MPQLTNVIYQLFIEAIHRLMPAQQALLANYRALAGRFGRMVAILRHFFGGMLHVGKHWMEGP